MREHSKKKAVEDAIKLGRMLTTADLNGIPLETAIDTTMAEVVRRTRCELMLELVDEFMIADRQNAARWLLKRIQTELAEHGAEFHADMAYCVAQAAGSKRGERDN